MVGLEKKEKKLDQEEEEARARRSEANPCPGKAY